MTPKLDCVAVIAEDMAASLAFYRRLGLDVPADADDQPHVEAVLPGGLRFMWDSVATVLSIDPEWTKPVGGNSIGLAFRCDDPADVDKTYAELVAAGYQGGKEPWDAFWGQRYAAVVDPDGNTVDLFAPLD